MMISCVVMVMCWVMLSVETGMAAHNFVILSKTAPNLLHLASPDDKGYDDEKFVIVGRKTPISFQCHVTNFWREFIQGVFFTGPPPKKLKYGKPRLGEVRCI